MSACAQYMNECYDPKGMAMAAYIQMRAERFGFAVPLLERALQLTNIKEIRSPLLNNLGMCFLGCSDLEKAERTLKEALKADPNNWAAMNNLSLTYVHQCEPLKAIEWAEKAEKYNSIDQSRDETVGYAYLMLGMWEKGWKCFEGSLNGKVRKPRSYHGEGYWDGAKGIKLVARGEQGIGDEISFARVLLDVKDVDLYVECDKRLEGLFRRSLPYPVHGTRFQNALPWMDFKPDAHVLFGSLCQYYRNKDEDFTKEPWLKPDPERVLQWKTLLDTLPGRKIGIAWTGGRHNTFSERRSLSLEDLLPIFNKTDTFISLQYKDPTSEIAAFEKKAGIKVHHWARASEAADYDETAALVSSLDLVISVQTAVVHLASGLGVPTKVLVPSKPHWRYGTKEFMWGKVDLYRQKSDWKEVIQSLANDMERQSV